LYHVWDDIVLSSIDSNSIVIVTNTSTNTDYDNNNNTDSYYIV
jgi:hypothetical protein